MKTGDTVRDGHGRTFQVGQLLGRGIWGRTYACREDGSGAELVVKVPLGARDVAGQDPRLAAVCREIAAEQARLLQQLTVGFPRLHSTFQLEDGSPALVLQRWPESMERRIAAGCTFEELLATVVQVIRRLRTLTGAVTVHGNLKPSNVLLDERGEVGLADPMTPAMRRNLDRLLAGAPLARGYHPPELLAPTNTAPLGTVVDTYAVATMLYRGAMASKDGGEPTPPLAAGALDKARLVELRDRISTRLKEEHSNPRFHTKLSDRAGALLNRALSLQTSPSPPYRFGRLDEFLARTEEVLALVHPTVTHVGRLILNLKAGKDAFTTEDEVAFTSTVACSAGVEDHEEIACGLAVFDTDRGERLRNVPCSYSVDRHHSGRYRFQFRVPDLQPGGYRVRVAFAIRDSGEEPVTAEGTFSVRAAPGYVPPPVEPERRPIPLTRGANEQRLPPDPAEPSSGWLDPERPAATIQVLPKPDGRAAAAVVVPPDAPPPEPAPDNVVPIPTPIAPTRSNRPHDVVIPHVEESTPLPPAARKAARAVVAEDAPVSRPLPPPRPAPLPERAPATRTTDSGEPAQRRRPTDSGEPAPRPSPAPARPDNGASRPAPRPEQRAPARTTAPLKPARATRPAAPSAADDPLPNTRWSELPLPNSGEELERAETKRPARATDPYAGEEAEPSGPIGAVIGRVLDLVKADAYVLFLGAATIVIVLLGVILLALR